jgi:uncharacterized protein (TIGR03086 family)
MDPTSIFKSSIDQTGAIVAGVKPDQLAATTPCTDWDVRALLNHTIAAVQMFDTAARGGEFDGSNFAEDQVGNDPAASYESAAARLRDALEQPGVLEAMWNMPFGTVPGMMAVGFATLELAQHGWDIARATGQQPDFDTDVTETAFSSAKLAPAELVRVPGVFGPESPCPDGAPAHDQLAAFMGRQL